MGVSVENDKYRSRIANLRSTGAHVKFLSLEPLLGPLTALNLLGIDWVIVGGESGPRARPMDPAWVTDLAISADGRRYPFFETMGRQEQEAGRTRP
jgi:protein gp37